MEILFQTARMLVFDPAFLMEASVAVTSIFLPILYGQIGGFYDILKVFNILSILRLTGDGYR